MNSVAFLLVIFTYSTYYIFYCIVLMLGKPDDADRHFSNLNEIDYTNFQKFNRVLNFLICSLKSSTYTIFKAVNQSN